MLWRWPGVRLSLIERQAWNAEAEELERYELLWSEITGDSALPND